MRRLKVRAGSVDIGPGMEAGQGAELSPRIAKLIGLGICAVLLVTALGPAAS